MPGTISRTVGTLSPINSLIGPAEDSSVGGAVAALDGGRYVVASAGWDSDTATNVGAITWCRAGGVTVGAVTDDNSLTGSSDGDRIGSGQLSHWGTPLRGIRAFADDNYVVYSPAWDNSGLTDAGAITLASGKFRMTGTVAPWNSVVGGVTNGGVAMTYDYDPNLHRLIVGRPAENLVNLFTMDQIFADGVEP